MDGVWVIQEGGELAGNFPQLVVRYTVGAQGVGDEFERHPRQRLDAARHRDRLVQPYPNVLEAGVSKQRRQPRADVRIATAPS